MPIDPFGGPNANQIISSAGKLKFGAVFSEYDPIVSFLVGRSVTYPTVYPNTTIGGYTFHMQAMVLADQVDKLAVDIRSFRTPLRRIVEQVIIPSIKTNFAEGGRPRWQPLSEGTIDNRKGSAQPVLVRTGRLRRVATQRNMWNYFSVTDGEINAVSFNQEQLEKRAKYGTFHQYGAMRFNARVGLMIGGVETPRLELPARPFVQLIGSETTEAQIIMYHWLSERVDYQYYGFGNKPGRR